jgi:branched-chain amino acid transport system substrate-binding protein
MLKIEQIANCLLVTVFCLSTSHAVAQAAATGEAGTIPKTLTIGVAAPLSGTIAHLGRAISRGVALAVEQANEATAGDGKQTIRFDVVEQDDEADPKRAIAVATALADRGVFAVVGHLNSGLSIPASRTYASRGIPMVTPASSNPNLTEQGLSNVFRVVARDDMQPAALFAVARHEGLKRIAILAERGSYGDIVGRSAVAQADSFPVRVVLVETGLIPDGIATQTLGERMANLELDGVLLVGSSDLLQAVLRTATKANAKPLRILATDYACSEDAFALQIQPHRVTCSSPDPDDALIDETFVRAYARKFGERPRPYAATAFDAASLIVRAARTAASTHPADIALRLRLTAYSGVTGTISFDKRGDRIGAPVLLSEIAGGKPQLKYVVQSGKLNVVKSATN